eukprot:3174912-Amphidinium_carterae.1
MPDLPVINTLPTNQNSEQSSMGWRAVGTGILHPCCHEEWGIPKAYSSFEELLKDEAVEAKVTRTTCSNVLRG